MLINTVKTVRNLRKFKIQLLSFDNLNLVFETNEKSEKNRKN